MYSRIRLYLKRSPLAFHEDKEKEMFHFPVSKDGASSLVKVFIDDFRDVITIYSYATFHVPEDRRAEVAQAVCRANYGLRIGNFELDMDDGELRYKTSAYLDGVEPLPDSVLHPLFHLNFNTFFQYLDAFLKCAFGSASALEVITEAEPPRSRPRRRSDDADEPDAPTEEGGARERPSRRAQGQTPGEMSEETKKSLRDRLVQARAEARRRREQDAAPGAGEDSAVPVPCEPSNGGDTPE